MKLIPNSDCKKCYGTGTTGHCYRCPLWPVWHYFCECPAGELARQMYGENVGPDPSRP